MKTISKFKRLFTVVGLSLCLASQAFSQTQLLSKLKKYSDGLPKEFDKIPAERQEALKQIGDYVLASRKDHKKAILLFICTHNSRRSQMGQAWGMTAAEYYGLDSVIFFSGGTEATAFNSRAISALQRAGFDISKGSGSTTNPNYTVSNKKVDSPWLMYSKKYSDRQNPQSDFAAIMVCSEADKSCPMVAGAAERISLPYDDPKYYDGTPSEKVKYDETCRLIAREMFFVFDYVKKQSILTIESKR